MTPPVTMYQLGGVVGVEVERQGGTVGVSSEVAFGVLPPWTLGLHTVAIQPGGAALELARVHLATRVRLVKRDRPREWILVSLYGAGALPAGHAAARVAETHGVPGALVGISAARMARRGDLFADLSVARASSPTGGVTIGALGVAVGWRPAPAAYGRAELQLFAEARAQYREAGGASVGIAPGVLVHSRNAVLKFGVLFPAWTRRTPNEPALRFGAKLLI